MDFPINSRTSSQPPNKQEISQLAMFEYQNVPSLAMPRLCPSWRAPGAADIGRRSDGIPPAARLRGRPPEHHVIICYPPRVRFQSAKNFNSTARTDIYSTKSGDTTLPKLELVSIFDFFGGQSPRHGTSPCASKSNHLWSIEPLLHEFWHIFPNGGWPLRPLKCTDNYVSNREHGFQYICSFSKRDWSKRSRVFPSNGWIRKPGIANSERENYSNNKVCVVLLILFMSSAGSLCYTTTFGGRTPDISIISSAIETRDISTIPFRSTLQVALQFKIPGLAESVSPTPHQGSSLHG